MIRRLRLTVLTPVETLLDAEEVTWVQARLADGGGIGIYPGHAPLIAETVTAPLRYADPSGERTLNLEAGILQVDGDGVTVFTSGEAQTSEISRQGQPEAAEVPGGPRFDRLARALLATARERPEGEPDVGESSA